MKKTVSATIAKFSVLGAIAALTMGSMLPAQAQSKTQSNAVKRCQAHQSAATNAACQARVQGGSDVRVSGSIRGGGVLRENLSTYQTLSTPSTPPVLMVWDRKSTLTTYGRTSARVEPAQRDPARWYN